MTYESFDAKLRDELLNGEVFFTLKEARVVIEPWQRHFNSIRPHAALSNQPPAPEVCARSHPLANGTERLSADRAPCHRHATDNARTSNLDHQIGAGQVAPTAKR